MQVSNEDWFARITGKTGTLYVPLFSINETESLNPQWKQTGAGPDDPWTKNLTLSSSSQGGITPF